MVNRIAIEDFIRQYGLVPVKSVPGHQFTSVDEMSIIASLIAYTGSRDVAEIGTAEGNTAAAVLEVSPEIETWTGFDVEGERIADTPEKIGHLCNDPRYRIVLRPAELHAVPCCDACFVDGSHKREAVLPDSINALNNARKLVIWHDYEGVESDVDGVVDDLSQYYCIEHPIGSRLAYAVMQSSQK